MPSFAKRQIQYAPKGVIDDQIQGIIEDELAPESLAFTYNLDGTVDGIDGATTNLDFAYNLDGSVDTIDDQSVLRTFSYNPDGTVSDITIS